MNFIFLSSSSVRSSFYFHFETNFENAGEGWVNLKCTLVFFFFFLFSFILFSGIQIAKKKFVFQGLVYRYDVSKSSDGVAGEEGTFCMCTLWYVSFFAFFFFSVQEINYFLLGVSRL